MDRESADKLTDWMMHVQSLPLGAKDIGDAIEQEVNSMQGEGVGIEREYLLQRHAEEVRTIAGYLRGISNLIRV